MIDQSEMVSRSQVEFITHFLLEVHICVARCTSHCKLHQFGAEKPIS
jgi:hypothetical protein